MRNHFHTPFDICGEMFILVMRTEQQTVSGKIY